MYLVTIDPDTDDAIARTVDDDGLDRMLDYFRRSQVNRDGRAILIRHADYLDTKAQGDVPSVANPGRTRLTLIQGGQ